VLTAFPTPPHGRGGMGSVVRGLHHQGTTPHTTGGLVMGKGIDYGMGTTNVDRTNGIRYGVISMNDVLQAWCDCSEGDYGEPHCPHCGGELPRDLFSNGRFPCPHCEEQCEDWDCWSDEAIGWSVDDGEYKAESGSSGDVFVLCSPYFTRAQFCSPCAPGACHLAHPMDDGERAYCFGHDWFDGGVAPYPVYRVDTGEMVEPEAK
jgi:ribosomal protein L37AE/L43A